MCTTVVSHISLTAQTAHSEQVAKNSHFVVLILFSVLGNSWACSSKVNEAAGRNDLAKTWVSPLAASAMPHPSSQKPVQAEQIHKTWSNRFRFSTKSISERREGNRAYEISADIPQIMSMRTASTRKFNLWIRKKLLGHVAEFRQLERSAEVSDRRKRLPPLHISETLELGYQVYYSNKRLVSLRLTQTVMAVGQMHPIDYYETINYDLRKGRPLRPTDIFKVGYLRSLSAYCRNEFRNKYDLKYLDAPLVNEGTSPEKDNFDSWNIVPEGILISFADYQVGPHAFGKPEMIVPYSALREVLIENSLIREFVR